MAAEQDQPHVHHIQSAHRQSTSHNDCHRDSDRGPNPALDRYSDSRIAEEYAQSQSFEQDGDQGFLEPESSTLADPINPYPSSKPAIQTKIYIGGLPELTRLEDLDDCFSQLGRIKNIELKSGYGFVDFDNPQSACDAIAKYHEGTFLGSQIKVEISHGGSRPRHVAVSNNPEACYTCGVAGHWARDCPEADGRMYHKRRLRPRSRTPPRGRENNYIQRDSRPQHFDLLPDEHSNHVRRRSPLGQIDHFRDRHDQLAAPPLRERYPVAAYADEKHYRHDHSFSDRERDHPRALDLKPMPHQSYRDSQMMLPALSRSPPPIPREYLPNNRARHSDPYLSRPLPRGHDGPIQEMKSKSAYDRHFARPHEPVRSGGYDDRLYSDQRGAYPMDRMSGHNPMDQRHEMQEARFSRGDSPPRFRSPRRSLSPGRRGGSNNYRNSYRGQSPPGVRPGHNVGPASYTRTAYPMRR